VDGFLRVDKPAGITTFAVVRTVRSALRERHAGHAGTLDPAATGLVVVALGACTRLLPYLPLEPKQYEFEIRFGFETDSLDDTGKRTVGDGTVPSEQQVRQILPTFTGAVTQNPPRFSAVKIDGERAYARARRDEDFQTSPRQVHIHSLELRGFDTQRGAAQCRVSCSSGTYVRSLAADIGTALAARAHAAGIRRTALGRFLVEEAVGAASTAEAFQEALLSPYDAFEGFPRPVLDQAQLRELAHGRKIRLPVERQDLPVVAFGPGNALAAVLQLQPDNWYQPLRVFVPLPTTAGAA